MKQILLFLISLFLFFSGRTQTSVTWLRYPAISPDGKTIVFTWHGDLYTVSAKGGLAIPVTQNEAHDFMPVWSHDGNTIAFASSRHGNFDIYTISSKGGEARRLTYHSANEYPFAFSPDDKFVYFGATRLDAASNRQYPAEYMPELYQVSSGGGRVLQVLTTPAEDVQWSKDGRFMLYHDRKGSENQWRKHQMSSIARDIWMFDSQNGTHTKLTDFSGEDRNPVYTGDEKGMYYLSEQHGSFNVYRMNFDDRKPQQVTHFTKGPVRFLTRANDGTLCFGYDGDIYIKTENSEPKKVSVQIYSESKTNDVTPLNISSSGIGSLAVSPNEKEVAFVFRGDIFVSSVDGGTTKRITDSPEPDGYVSFSPDGRTLLYASEKKGIWQVYQTTIVRKEEPYFFNSTVLKESLVLTNPNGIYKPKYSPNGEEIAFVENRANLSVYNLKTHQQRSVLTEQELFSIDDNDKHFNWSPDGKWILFEYSTIGSPTREIGVVSASGKGRKLNLTESGFNAYIPKWSSNGDMMLWASEQEGLHSIAHTGPSQTDVYANFINQAALDKFNLSKEEFDLTKDTAKADTSVKKQIKNNIEPVVFDADGLTNRKVRLTTGSAMLSDYMISNDGEKLYYGVDFNDGFDLWEMNLRTKETKRLLPLKAKKMEIFPGKDGKFLFLLADGKISRFNTANSEENKVDVGGYVNLNVAEERKAMFEHVWQRVKQIFYTAGYHGADWDEIKQDYEKFLPGISNNYEFSEMLSEMLGELNVSHSGAHYSPKIPHADSTASLGIFYDQTYTGDGVKIDEVLKEGPLTKDGMDIKPGTLIKKINGVVITPDDNLPWFLNRQAGKILLLSVLDPGSKAERDIKVKPITSDEESILVYKRWVQRNADEVNKLTNGEIGYVHIPDMDDPSFRVVYEKTMGKFASKKAMVIDTRNNEGGDLVSDLVTFLTGKKFLTYQTDTRPVGFEPYFRWTKPSIALANETNYSDGDCFAFSYQYLKIGKLVGMPVPGTCNWAGSERLQDRTLSWGVPPLGVQSMNGKFIENHQITPDIQLMNEYDKVSKGQDQQLEAAIKEIMKEVSTNQ